MHVRYSGGDEPPRSLRYNALSLSPASASPGPGSVPSPSVDGAVRVTFESLGRWRRGQRLMYYALIASGVVALGFWVVTGQFAPMSFVAVAVFGAAVVLSAGRAAGDARLESALALLQTERPIEAQRIVERAGEKFRSKWLLALATELDARAWLMRGSPDAAQKAVARFPAGYAPSAGLHGVIFLELGEVERARILLERAAVEDPEDGRRALAGPLIEAYLLCHDYDRAVEWAHESEQLSLDALMELAVRLFEAKRYRDMADITAAAWQQYAMADSAYNHACARVQLGELQEAIEWLERAVEAGYEDGEHMLADRDLLALRDKPRFVQLAASLRAVRGRLARELGALGDPPDAPVP